MNLNLITGPSFVAGLLNGYNRRQSSNYKHDPYAHYKLLSLTSGLAFARVLGDSVTHVAKPISPSILFTGVVGGLLVSGTSYCMGSMLTRIPSKDMFE